MYTLSTKYLLDKSINICHFTTTGTIPFIKKKMENKNYDSCQVYLKILICHFTPCSQQTSIQQMPSDDSPVFQLQPASLRLDDVASQTWERHRTCQPGAETTTGGGPATTDPVPAHQCSTISPFCKCTIFKARYDIFPRNSLVNCPSKVGWACMKEVLGLVHGALFQTHLETS